MTGQLGTSASRLGLMRLGTASDSVVVTPPATQESLLRNDVVTLCWPNRIGSSVLSGGAWQPTLPLENIANKVFAKKARSLNVDESSTQFRISLDKGRPVAVVSLAAHNLSQDAEVRVVAYANVEGVGMVYDSGFLPAWPASYLPETLEWEDNNFWFGDADLDVDSEYTPLTTVFFGDIYNAEAVDVFIRDLSNVDGYVDIGRCFISGAWQPETNMSYGLEYGHIIGTTVEEANDGTEYFDRKRAKRTVSLSLDWLTQSEAFSRIYAMQRDQGIDREILFAHELNASDESFYRTFIGRLQQPDPIANPYYATHTNRINIQEII